MSKVSCCSSVCVIRLEEKTMGLYTNVFTRKSHDPSEPINRAFTIKTNYSGEKDMSRTILLYYY